MIFHRGFRFCEYDHDYLVICLKFLVQRIVMIPCGWSLSYQYHVVVVIDRKFEAIKP
jgi:hypothetical protein